MGAGGIGFTYMYSTFGVGDFTAKTSTILINPNLLAIFAKRYFLGINYSYASATTTSGDNFSQKVQGGSPGLLLGMRFSASQWHLAYIPKYAVTIKTEDSEGSINEKDEISSVAKLGTRYAMSDKTAFDTEVTYNFSDSKKLSTETLQTNERIGSRIGMVQKVSKEWQCYGGFLRNLSQFPSLPNEVLSSPTTGGFLGTGFMEKKSSFHMTIEYAAGAIKRKAFTASGNEMDSVVEKNSFFNIIMGFANAF